MDIPRHQMPGKKAIIPYYAAGALSIVIIGLLTFISRRDFSGHFFQPHLLAITHLTVLGWGTMVIMGASNQLIPVIADQKLYNERIPVAVFVLLVIGTCLLVHSFWNFELGAVMLTGASFVLTAFILHAINMFLTSKKAQKNNIIVDFVLTAHIWLIVTGAIGATLLLNFRFGFLPADHLHYLKVHASVGMAGWFLLLIIGVTSRLIPMFLLSRKEVKKYLAVAYYLINSGLVLLLIEGMVLRSTRWHLVYIALVVVGLLFYLAYIRHCYKSAIRKKIDAGMKQTFVALGVIALPFLFLVIAALCYRQAPVAMLTAYGYSFFAGFITILIMGQTFKTLPFIVWMHLSRPGKLAELQPKDLYNERLVGLQMLIYLPGFLLFLSGILLKLQLFTCAGSVTMLSVSVLYFGHVLHVINKLRK
jgi:hypothetical protein